MTSNRALACANASLPLPHIDEMPRDRGGGGHCRRHQVRAAARALPAFEIAVRCRSATLLRAELVGIHREAHGAAGLAPFEAGLDKDFVQPFRLGLLLYQA